MHIFFNVSSSTPHLCFPHPNPAAPPPGVAIVLREAGPHDLPQSARRCARGVVGDYELRSMGGDT